MLPIRITSRPVARMVTTMKIDQLRGVGRGLLVQELHRSDTSVPRATGANSMHAQVGHLRGVAPQRGGQDGPQEVGLLRRCRRRRRSPPTAGRRGWCPCRSARRRRRRRCRGTGRCSSGCTAGPAACRSRDRACRRTAACPAVRTARGWLGSSSRLMCRVNPRNASAWSLPALTMPLVRQGNSGEYFANTRSCWAASWLTRMMFVVVLRQEAAGGVGEPGDVVEQLVELLLATLERVAGRHRVAQRGGDVGEHVGVEVGGVREQAQVLDEGGDLRVDPLEVGVEGLEVLAEPVAAALEGGGQRVERLVELGRLDRAQQRVEVVERLLDLGGHHGPLDGVAGLDVVAGRAASGICSATYFSPNSVLGSIRAVTLLGMVSTWLG